jgi:hypothetical protein
LTYRFTLNGSIPILQKEGEKPKLFAMKPSE